MGTIAGAVAELEQKVERLEQKVKTEFERGFTEGECKQAILELQGQDRFLSELKCKKCGAKAVRRSVV